MRSERIICTALPSSSAPEAPFHVTAFLTPRLDADEPSELRHFPHLLEWAALVEDGVTFRIWDQNGPMDTTRVPEATPAAVWSSAFPGTLRVKTNGMPAWAGRDVVSYPAAETARVAKELHLKTVVSSLSEPPTPSEHPLYPAFKALVDSGRASEPGRARKDLDERYQDRDVPWTAREFSEVKLGELLDSGGARSLAAMMGGGDVARAAVAALQTMRRAANYFAPAQPPDTSGAPPERLAEPPQPLPEVGPEFHERVAAAGDLPALLRALRLAVRLTGDPARLRAATHLAVEIVFADGASLGRYPLTRVAHLRGGVMVVAERDGDPGIVDGALALGDAAYSVIDLDVDGSALKDHGFLTDFVRLMAIEDNGDDVTAGTPALRSTGLAVARSGRAAGVVASGQNGAYAPGSSFDEQAGIDARLAGEAPVLSGPELRAHHVARGMRIEVWDDVTRRWHSLHTRRSTISVDGFGDVATDALNEGTLQGTTAHERPAADENGHPSRRPADAGAIYIHENVFGWDGWSLSAPRPGKTIADKPIADPDSPTGYRQVEEMVADPADDDPRTPPHPFRFSHRVEPGTLPRLRYGRAYSFRAWTVDLAGESRPHELVPRPPRDLEALGGTLAGARIARILAAQRGTIALGDVEGFSAGLDEGVRAASAARLRRAEDAAPIATPVDELPERLRTLVGLRDAADAATHRGAALRGAATRTAATAAAWQVIAARRAPVVIETALDDPALQTALVGTHLQDLGIPGIRPADVTRALRGITPPVPFLRWDPVPPPALVPLSRYTEGESLRTIVVRTGIDIAEDTGETVVRHGTEYLDDVEARHPGLVSAQDYRPTGERHLAPPRVAQAGAELHGMFDDALQEGGAALDEARRRVLAWSLREDGSFFSRTVVDLEDPLGTGLVQPGIALVHDAGVDPAALRTLDDVQPGPPPRGMAPAPGQYIVHDTEELRLPYLPDPLAIGVSITFVDAGFSRVLAFPFGGEGFTADYRGQWPEREPYRLVVESGDAHGARIDDRTIIVTLPPGERVRLRLASSIDPQRLKQLALWPLLLQELAGVPDAETQAVAGRIWGLSPSEGVVLVNATPRPVARPVLIDDPWVMRWPGSADGVLEATFAVHGASTENLTAEGEWVDDVDDLAAPAPARAPGSLVAFTSQVAADETIVPFDRAREDHGGPRTYQVAEVGAVTEHDGAHTYPDTKHRLVTFRLRAQTRYQEYFPPALRSAEAGAVVPDTDGARDDGQSQVSRPFAVHVDNTTVPAIPRVDSVLPLLRWTEESEPHQPAAVLRTRRSGVRIWLRRPWFDTGSGELLALLLSPAYSRSESAMKDAPERYSQWGSDPIWREATVSQRLLTRHELDNRLRWDDDDERAPRPGRPASEPRTVVAPGDEGGSVLAVGYEPVFDPARGMWRVDVAFDADEAFWPFVRLTVARYQPHSLDGHHVSEPVRLDFVQLPPTRALSVSRTGERGVRVALSGAVQTRGLDGLVPPKSDDRRSRDQRIAKDRVVVALLQQRTDASAGDLAWETRVRRELPLRGDGVVPPGEAWEGELVSPEPIAFRTPRGEEGDATWRLFVEEWEVFPTDPVGGDPDRTDEVSYERRLVYADVVHL